MQQPNPILMQYKKCRMPSIRLKCIKELGYALMYMDYLHPSTGWREQRLRVIKLCEELVGNSEDPSLTYWKKFLKRIENEIENMC